MEFKVETRSFSRILRNLCIFIEVLFLGVIFYGLLTSDKFKVDLDVFILLLVPLGFYVIGVLLFWLVARFITVKLYKEGFYSPATSFLFRTVTWSEIIGAEPVYSDGLHYVRVWSKDTKRLISIPMFLEDFNGFSKTIEEYAGSDHVIVKAISKFHDKEGLS